MPDNKILIMIGGMAFLLPAAPFLALAGIGLIVVGCIIYSIIKCLMSRIFTQTFHVALQN